MPWQKYGAYHIVKTLSLIPMFKGGPPYAQVEYLCGKTVCSIGRTMSDMSINDLRIQRLPKCKRCVKAFHNYPQQTSEQRAEVHQ